MKKIAIGLLLSAMSAGATMSWGQQAVLPDLGRAFETLLLQAKPAIAAAKAASVKEFDLKFGGDAGQVWRLVPDTTPPDSDLDLEVAQGDHVQINLATTKDTDWTSFELAAGPATVDGKPCDSVYIYISDFKVVHHVVEFDAAKPGVFGIWALYSGKVTQIGNLTVKEQQAKTAK